MINKVLNFIKWFKDWLDLILKLVAIAGLLMGVFGMKGCSKHKQEKENAIDIASSQVTQHRSKSDKLITETITWDIKYNALKQHYEEKDNKNKAIISRYKQELNEAKQTIADMDIKAKNVHNYIKNELVSRDSIRTELVFLDCENIEIKPIEKKHIKIDFIQNGSFLDVKYLYSAKVQTVVSRYPELKKNGKKHFPNWGWLWGYDYKTTSTIDDENASISNLVSIEFDKD
jgi:hypothetical protein